MNFPLKRNVMLVIAEHIAADVVRMVILDDIFSVPP